MLYDRTGGHTYAVGVLPNGTTSSCSVELGNAAIDNGFEGGLSYGAISLDGSNVIFTIWGLKSCSPGLYLREDNTKTVQIPGRVFLGRSADGTKIFSQESELEFAGSQTSGVYEYDIASGQSTVISPEGWFLAASADGSRVYYLITGKGAASGVHLWDKGSTTLIPGTGEGFAGAVQKQATELDPTDVSVATQDGSKLLFVDRAKLTTSTVTSAGCITHNEKYGLKGSEGFPQNCPEAYVYDANTGHITCVSCNPNDAPPLGVTHLMGNEVKNPALPSRSDGEISPDGARVFFETEDALVPQDTNGLPDVYEWENGRAYLISSGQGVFGSAFSGASTDGRDVFLTTTDHLAPQVVESSTQIYDARIGGGFPYRPFVPGCDSGQCQGPQTPAPAFEAPASATFVGLGNPVQIAAAQSAKAKPKVKPKMRNKRKPKKRKQGKRGRGAHRASRVGTANGKRRK